MIIDIKSDMMLKDLKKQFHSYYPHLKIEFFSEERNQSGRNSREQMLSNEALLSDIKGFIAQKIEFSGDTTVAAFEAMFADMAGLNVQVFRKSGNVYLETSNTDDWTLDQEHKEALSSQVKAESGSSDFTDRDQWE
ncbi:MAG: hypothetical protein ACKOXF_08515 [Chitinophagaceae bacterium]